MAGLAPPKVLRDCLRGVKTTTTCHSPQGSLGLLAYPIFTAIIKD